MYSVNNTQIQRINFGNGKSYLTRAEISQIRSSLNYIQNNMDKYGFNIRLEAIKYLQSISAKDSLPSTLKNKAENLLQMLYM